MSTLSTMQNNEASITILMQFVSLMLIVPLGWIFGDKSIAASLGIGGALCFIPNLFLYRSVFKYKGASEAKAIVQGLYLGEILKIILTFCLFLFVLRYMIWLSMLYLFVGYIVLQLTFWMIPIYFGIKKNT